MEAQLVPKHGIPIRFIQISGLRGKGIKALLGAPFAILRAVLQARKIIQEYQPNAVLGMGVMYQALAVSRQNFVACQLFYMNKMP